LGIDDCFAVLTGMHTKHHRLPKECYQGPISTAFTFCLEGRPLFFASTGIVGVFVKSLREVAKKQDFCGVYCFMPDHVHLVLFGNTDDANSLHAVELFKQMTGYWLKRNYLRIQRQKGFRDRILRESEIAPVVRYALDNPVRRGLVTQWREYPFTGAIGLDLEQLVADLATDEF
jgi:REP-associated tyrosine transposase